MNNINLTPIFQALIVLLASLITYKLVPYIKARTTAKQQSTMHALYKTLVFAAEQLYGAGHGSEKFRYVQNKLAEKGYDIDADMIEATVAQYLNYAPNLTLYKETDDDEDADDQEA